MAQVKTSEERETCRALDSTDIVVRTVLVEYCCSVPLIFIGDGRTDSYRSDQTARRQAVAFPFPPCGGMGHRIVLVLVLGESSLRFVSLYATCRPSLELSVGSLSLLCLCFFFSCRISTCKFVFCTLFSIWLEQLCVDCFSERENTKRKGSCRL